MGKMEGKVTFPIERSAISPTAFAPHARTLPACLSVCLFLCVCMNGDLVRRHDDRQVMQFLGHKAMQDSNGVRMKLMYSETVYLRDINTHVM